MRSDDSVVPFSPTDKQVLADPDIIRRAVCLEFSRLLFEYATLKHREALQTIHQLQTTLEWAFRIERRIYLRRGLTVSAQDYPGYQVKLKLWEGPGPSGVEDFRAVERHLDQGADLFEGLRRRSKAVG
jgi:hypothetical protein